MTVSHQPLVSQRNILRQPITPSAQAKRQIPSGRIKDIAAIACSGLSATLAMVLQESLIAIPGFAVAMGLNILNRRQDTMQLCEQMTHRNSHLEKLYTVSQQMEVTTQTLQQSIDQAIAHPTPSVITGKLEGRGRVCILIDEANLYAPIRSQNKRIDYAKLLAFLSQDTTSIDKALVFLGHDPGNERQDRFHRCLITQGYHLILKKTIHRIDGSSKANFDVEITLQMLQRLPHYDTLVLVSGDGDFAAAIKQIQGFGTPCGSSKLV